MSETSITLPESLTIHQIEGHLGDLRMAFQADADTLNLEASSIEAIDTSGLQLLLALIKQAQSQNKTIQWITPSEQLTTSATKLGLTEKLMLS
ncbi:STAS domain-containing protein [Hydrogenovibrio kuenenii]|uniref:STAS domain-containing protein n=1 Tax=Hydrogenovibrio kuenenii TaxID=63658 RepID=UPI000463666C|nr:STAS domain-containing protein [Hydrogenovibrio kuenenii]